MVSRSAPAILIQEGPDQGETRQPTDRPALSRSGREMTVCQKPGVRHEKKFAADLSAHRADTEAHPRYLVRE